MRPGENQRGQEKIREASKDQGRYVEKNSRKGTSNGHGGEGRHGLATGEEAGDYTLCCTG